MARQSHSTYTLNWASVDDCDSAVLCIGRIQARAAFIGYFLYHGWWDSSHIFTYNTYDRYTDPCRAQCCFLSFPPSSGMLIRRRQMAVCEYIKQLSTASAKAPLSARIHSEECADPQFELSEIFMLLYYNNHITMLKKSWLFGLPAHPSKKPPWRRWHCGTLAHNYGGGLCEFYCVFVLLFSFTCNNWQTSAHSKTKSYLHSYHLRSYSARGWHFIFPRHLLRQRWEFSPIASILS